MLRGYASYLCFRDHGGGELICFCLSFFFFPHHFLIYYDLCLDMYTLGGIFGLGWIMVYDLWLDMIWLGLEWVWHRQKEIFGGFYLFYSWACLNCLLFWLHLTLVKQVSLKATYTQILCLNPQGTRQQKLFSYILHLFHFLLNVCGGLSAFMFFLFFSCALWAYAVYDVMTLWPMT